MRHLPLNEDQKSQISAVIALSAVPHPQYTCPFCRANVKSKPVEVYALKNLVRIVAKAEGEGEESPRKEVPSKEKGKRSGPVLSQGPWDRFFPKAQV